MNKENRQFSIILFDLLTNMNEILICLTSFRQLSLVFSSTLKSYFVKPVKKHTKKRSCRVSNVIWIFTSSFNYSIVREENPKNE